MPDRSWFFAANGQQQGPYPEAQLRDFIARGTIGADTLVWTEGMSGWLKAGDVPGLLARGGAAAAMPRTGAVPIGDGSGLGSGPGAGELSIDFGIWEFTWRSLVLLFGILFIIPVPWVITMYCRWLVSCVRVPQRPNLTFTGRPVDLMWFYGAVALFIIDVFIKSQALNLALNFVQLALYWLLIKWFVAKLSSDGQPLGLRFSGSFWGYLGWNLLTFLSVITIVGWAWVYVAQTRWMCRHIEGTRRAVVFKGSGLEFLWRSIVTVLVCLLFFTIPWMYRWFTRWLVSQVALVERTDLASVF
jgi:hypothetical protein